MALTNITLWDALRAKFPQFRSNTAKATAELFTAKGFEQLSSVDPGTLNDFFSLSMRVYLQLINVSRAKDTLEAKGFGEYYDMPLGAYIQRIAINSIKPISPAYKGLTNGTAPDPFVVRKPTQNERMYQQNFDYASLVTIPDEFAMKQIFISEYGMSEFMAGIFAGLENGYINQVYLNKLEAINAGLNSAAHPLKDTQKYKFIVAGDEPTAAELTEMILTVKNIVSAMDLGSQTDAYNALGFMTTQDVSRLKMLVRPGYKNAIATKVLASAYNQERLNLPIDVIEVPHFGGLTPTDGATTPATLYPQYNTLGEVIKFNTVAAGTGTDVDIEDVVWSDPNADVVAVIADKGWIFTTRQNPYSVEPIRNPRGLYTNYWASSPNNAISVDALYNVVTLSKATS